MNTQSQYLLNELTKLNESYESKCQSLHDEIDVLIGQLNSTNNNDIHTVYMSLSSLHIQLHLLNKFSSQISSVLDNYYLLTR